MLTIAQVYPELLGTYGDGGNGLVLAERARRRDVEVRLVTSRFGEPLVDADIYLLGGGEDGPQRLAVSLLREASFRARIDDGATVFAVCAGLQLLGTSFSVEGDDEFAGLGVVDAVTRRGARRAVGDFVTVVGDTIMVGFENHGGMTNRGDGVAPFGAVQRGRGNGDGHDGFRANRVWATYAHGPVLALNPWLADDLLCELLGWKSVEPLASVADRLYNERLRVLTRRGNRSPHRPGRG